MAALTAALAADQAAKAVVRATLPLGEAGLRMLGGLLVLHQQRNAGISFGLLEGGDRALLVLLAAVPVAFLFIYALRSKGGSRAALIGAGLICGGAVGNIIDRMIFGEVIDFIDLSFWPAFNLADAAVVIGIALFAAGLIAGRKVGDEEASGREREEGR